MCTFCNYPRDPLYPLAELQIIVKELTEGIKHCIDDISWVESGESESRRFAKITDDDGNLLDLFGDVIDEDYDTCVSKFLENSKHRLEMYRKCLPKFKTQLNVLLS